MASQRWPVEALLCCTSLPGFSALRNEPSMEGLSAGLRPTQVRRITQAAAPLCQRVRHRLNAGKVVRKSMQLFAPTPPPCPHTCPSKVPGAMERQVQGAYCKIAQNRAGPAYFRLACSASASATSFASGAPNPFAIALMTFKLGFRSERSSIPMYVGCKPAFSASSSWESPFESRCFLRVNAKASDICNRRIPAV